LEILRGAAQRGMRENTCARSDLCHTRNRDMADQLDLIAEPDATSDVAERPDANPCAEFGAVLDDGGRVHHDGHRALRRRRQASPSPALRLPPPWRRQRSPGSRI